MRRNVEPFQVRARFTAERTFTVNRSNQANLTTRYEPIRTLSVLVSPSRTAPTVLGANGLELVWDHSCSGKKVTVEPRAVVVGYITTYGSFPGAACSARKKKTDTSLHCCCSDIEASGGRRGDGGGGAASPGSQRQLERPGDPRLENVSVRHVGPLACSRAFERLGGRKTRQKTSEKQQHESYRTGRLAFALARGGGGAALPQGREEGRKGGRGCSIDRCHDVESALAML